MSTAMPAAAATPAPARPLRLSRVSDELLARYAARGSERAFGVIYERYHQPLYRYCRSIVRDEADAQDALQSTFTAALAALQRQARKAPLRPWLYRIAHNESVSVLRRRARDAHHQSVGDATALTSSAADEAVARARWQGLLEDLTQLPERQRGALLLREMAGLSHEEIAVALGLSVGGAKQAIFEARQGLAEVEEGRVMSCEEVRRRISEGDRRALRARRVRAHLRECAACEAFALAIPARQADLKALAPALSPAAATTILGRVLSATSSHGGSVAGPAATVGAAGKAAGAMIGWKSIAGAALVAGTAAGVAGLSHVAHHAQPAADRALMRAEQRPPAHHAPTALIHHPVSWVATSSPAPHRITGSNRSVPAAARQGRAGHIHAWVHPGWRSRRANHGIRRGTAAASWAPGHTQGVGVRTHPAGVHTRSTAVHTHHSASAGRTSASTSPASTSHAASSHAPSHAQGTSSVPSGDVLRSIRHGHMQTALISSAAATHTSSHK